MCILHCWTTSILLPLLIFNLKAKARKEGGNLNKHLQDARKMFSLHLTVPPDSSSPGERPFNLLARRQQTSHHVSYHRRALHRDPGALGPEEPNFTALLSLRLPHVCTNPLWPSWQQQVLGNIWSLTGNGLLWPMSLLAPRAKAKGPCWDVVQLLPCEDLLFHLEFSRSFLATLLKLPGKLLWLKISCSTPGTSALVWMWTDYFCCWNISTVRKSTINYICYSTYKIIY